MADTCPRTGYGIARVGLYLKFEMLGVLFVTAGVVGPVPPPPPQPLIAMSARVAVVRRSGFMGSLWKC